MTDAIQNGEVGSSVRAKLNENFVDVAALQAEAALSFDTVAALLADSTLTYTTAPAGTIVEAGGFRYTVAASAATDQHVATAGGVKLYVQPDAEGWRPLQAFGTAGDGAANDTAILQLALNVSPYLKGEPGAIYKVTTGVVIPSNRSFDMNGAKILKKFRTVGSDFFALRTEGSYNTDPAPWSATNINLKNIWIEDDGTSASRGAGLGFFGDNMTLDGFKTRFSAPSESNGANSAIISGKGIRIYRVDIDSLASGLRSDGLHFGYVEDLVICGGTIAAGDDAIAFSPFWLNFPWTGKDQISKNIHVSGMVLSTATSNGVRIGTLGDSGTGWPPHVNSVFQNVFVEATFGACGGNVIELYDDRTAAELTSGNKNTDITIRARVLNQSDCLRLLQVWGNLSITDVANIAQKNYGNVTIHLEGEQNDIASTGPFIRAGGVERLTISGSFETNATAAAVTYCIFSQIDRLILDGFRTKGRTTGTFASFQWVENIDVFNPLHIVDGTTEFQTYVLQVTTGVPMSFRMSGGRIVETARIVSISGTGDMRDFIIDGTKLEATTLPNLSTLFANVTWVSGASVYYNPAGGYQATVAQLAGSGVPIIEGHRAFATNGRKSGEGSGAGTGQPVYRNGTDWRVFRDDSVVLA